MLRDSRDLSTRTATTIWIVGALISLTIHVFIDYNLCCPEIPLVVDGANYEDEALQLLSSRTLLDPQFPGDKALSPPLWPLMITSLYLVVGHNLFAVCLLESSFVILTSFFTYRLGREQFDNFTGLAASLIVAFSITFLIHATNHSYEILIGTCLIASLYLFVHSHGFANRRKDLLVTALAAVFFGLGALSKAILLGLIPFILIWEFLQEQPGLPRKIVRSIIFVLIAFLTILPWTYRNYLVYREFILVNSNGGIIFEIGNNPWATGRYWIPPAWTWEESRREGTSLTRGLEFIKDTPERFLQLVPAKFGAFWSTDPAYFRLNKVIHPVLLGILQIIDIQWQRPHSEDVNHLSVLLLGIGMGMGILTSSKLMKVRVLPYFVVLYFSIVHLVFFGEPRFRIPIYPWLHIFQAYAVVKMIQWGIGLKSQWMRGAPNRESVVR